MIRYAREVVSIGRVGVNAVCRLLGISKKSYYYSQSPDERLRRRYCKLKGLIMRIIEENPSYGYRRLKKALAEMHGILVNHKLLKKLLKLWGLEFKRKIKKPSRSMVRKILKFLDRRANLLFSVKPVNIFKVIVSDITEILYRGGKAYLAVHLDIFGKMVYGWEASLHPDTFLVRESFKKAIKVVKRYVGSLRGIIFHQDQGSAYTSELYLRSVINQGGVLSYSRKGEPGDNAVNESFFSRLKEEWRDIFYEARSLEELKRLISKAIRYYNTSRYHSSLGYMTPEKFLKQEMTSLYLPYKLVS